VRQFLATHYTKAQLQRVMRRAMINFLQHPVPPRRQKYGE
jgi:hypothetical protein